MEHLKSDIKVSCAQLSQAGLKTVNEDSMGIRIPVDTALTHKGIVAVIADGVSAAEAGQQASQACVQNLLSDYYCTPDTWSVPKSVLAVLNALNRWLYSQGSHLPDNEKGFITTLSVVILKSSTAHIFHIGDSRIYRYREGQLECLTNDHSRQAGKVTYLARAMGLDTKIEVDYRKETLRQGDQFILTTDGIHDFFPDHLWNEVLSNTISLDEKVEILHKKALENGSNDNLSCQILQVDVIAKQGIDETYDNLSILPFPPLLEVGQVIDGYRVESVLHESNRSQLYKVVDVKTNQHAVMKTPSVNFEDDAAYIERFVMESWIGLRLKSNYIVNIIEPSQQPKYLYYLTEYIEGVTLSQWMRENPNPSIQDVMYWVEQIAKGLRAFHRRETLHQDLKPQNIMMTREGVVKIIDFGSCWVGGIAEIQIPFERDLVLGTASYSSPEQLQSLKSDIRSDQFSLATIVFEMLTAHLPYTEKYEQAKSRKDFSKMSYISAASLNPLIPIWFDAALKKAVSIDNKDRYGDIDEFIHDLKHPNHKLVTPEYQSLMEKNPLRFWQIICAVELLVILCLAGLLL